MVARISWGIFWAVLVAATSALAQPPDILWARTYGSETESELAYAIQQTPEGGFVVVGRRRFPDADHWDSYLVRTTSSGDTLWTRGYGGYPVGGDQQSLAYDVQCTVDGGYVLAGERNISGSGTHWDAYVVKTNSAGDTLWTRAYGGLRNDLAEKVKQTSDGGYVLVGDITDYTSGDVNIYLIKTDSQGDTLWTRDYGGNNTDYGFDVIQTEDGGYAIIGMTYYPSGGGIADVVFIRVGAMGDTLWSRTFGGSNRDQGSSVVQCSDGGFFIGGTSSSFSAGDYDMYVIRTDSFGSAIWYRTYGGYDDESLTSIAQTSDGGYVLAGDIGPVGAEEKDMYIIRITSAGDTLWSLTLGGDQRDVCRSVQQTSDGGYIFAGYTESFGAGEYDFWVVKTEPELATEPVTVSLPGEYSLCPNWPNPFNATTTIRYDVKQAGQVRLTIFNLLGQEVARLVNGRQVAGSHTISWDAADLPSGIYLCRMEAPGFMQTRKLVVVK